jgi:4-hydroxy-tetrahydrodipicolinate reductase
MGIGEPEKIITASNIKTNSAMKVALIGYGKMGNEIEKILIAQHAEIVLKITRDSAHELTIENLRKADVAIEFTRPDAAIENIYKCFEAGVPVVVGTTAWLKQLPEVSARCAAEQGGLFYAPNFSIGVNIFFEANRRLAQLMHSQPQYKVRMEEIHHTEKLDAPSGTAIKTAEVILEEIGGLKGWHLKGIQPIESSLEIDAIREPHVPGTHSTRFESEVDFIEIKHEAKSRRGFAEGAVAAARFMVGRSGVFEMKDLLGF